MKWVTGRPKIDHRLPVLIQRFIESTEFLYVPADKAGHRQGTGASL